MKPLVSIITPCYNAAAYLSETITSVISQTYINWEMLIIDDCSTDGSDKIIEQFCINDHRIKSFKTECSSGSPALPRNIGIENARGKYIAFLDADDIWLPEKLSVQIDFLEKSGYDFVYSDYEKISENGKRNNRIIRMPKSATYWDVIETCVIPCLTVILRKNIIGKTRFLNVAKEDLVFWLDIFRKKVTAYNCNKVLALYREQKSSRSSNKIAMIRNQWYILRNIERIKPLVASLFMVKYLYYGTLKFIK